MVTVRESLKSIIFDNVWKEISSLNPAIISPWFNSIGKISIQKVTKLWAFFMRGPGGTKLGQLYSMTFSPLLSVFGMWTITQQIYVFKLKTGEVGVKTNGICPLLCDYFVWMDRWLPFRDVGQRRFGAGQIQKFCLSKQRKWNLG